MRFLLYNRYVSYLYLVSVFWIKCRTCVCYCDIVLFSIKVFVTCFDVLYVCFVISCHRVKFVFYVMCYSEIVLMWHYLYITHCFCINLLHSCGDAVLYVFGLLCVVSICCRFSLCLVFTVFAVSLSVCFSKSWECDPSVICRLMYVIAVLLVHIFVSCSDIWTILQICLLYCPILLLCWHVEIL